MEGTCFKWKIPKSVLLSMTMVQQASSQNWKNPVRNRENTLRKPEKKNVPRKRLRKRKPRKNFKIMQKAVRIPKGLQNYAKSSTDTKRTSVWADSLEELIEKIKAVDWENVKAEKTPENGSRFDYSF